MFLWSSWLMIVFRIQNDHILQGYSPASLDNQMAWSQSSYSGWFMATMVFPCCFYGKCWGNPTWDFPLLKKNVPGVETGPKSWTILKNQGKTPSFSGRSSIPKSECFLGTWSIIPQLVKNSRPSSDLQYHQGCEALVLGDDFGWCNHDKYTNTGWWYTYW